VDRAKYAEMCRKCEAWPAGWKDAGRDRIWRSDVFEVAARWQRGHAPARHLLAATLVWGHGTNGYGPVRTGWSLATPDVDARLDAALMDIRSASPDPDALVAAYQRLRDPAASKITFMRASFFTKLLYFAGYRRGAGGVQPLILDSVVAGRLPEEVGIRRPQSSRDFPNWPAVQWLRYLEWAAVQAGSEEPDTVELGLFNQK